MHINSAGNIIDLFGSAAKAPEFLLLCYRLSVEFCRSC